MSDDQDTKRKKEWSGLVAGTGTGRESEMEWCMSIPKVELHAHLNGSIRDSTLLYVLYFPQYFNFLLFRPCFPTLSILL